MDTSWSEFFKWVEGTNLFRLIRDNPYADRIEGLSEDEHFSLTLVKGIKIEKASDLPFAILLNFYKHYTENL